MIQRILTMVSLGVVFLLSQAVSQEAKTTTWEGTLNAMGTKLRLEVDVTTDGETFSGKLRSLDQGNAEFKLSDVKVGSKLRFSVSQLRAKFVGDVKNGTAKGTFTQSGVKLPLTLTAGDSKTAKKPAKETFKEAWIGELNLGVMKPVMQFRIVELDTGKMTAYFDSITEGLTGFEAKYSNDGNELKFEVAKIRLKYSGKLDPTGKTSEGTWSQGGREFPLSLEKQPTVYDNKNTWENRPQRPKGPFPYESKEVTFENNAASVKLAGTLTIPKGDGKYPVVVLVSGSGPQDRDETLMGHKPFLVIADYLSRRGIAVLRYDDRGTGKSTGEFSKATTRDLATDAAAAVDFLKSHDQIDAQKIGLAGHSEGGLIAPIVADLKPELAFAVLMAGTGVDGAQIITSQTEAMLRANGVDEEEIKVGVTMNKAAIGVASTLKEGESMQEKLKSALETAIQTLPESSREEVESEIMDQIPLMEKQLGSTWMRYFIKYDPQPMLEKMKCPVLFVIGSKDMQVLPDLNMPAVEAALKKGGNQDYELVEFENLNHLFQECKTGALQEYASIDETFNPKVLQKIGDWITQRFVN